MLRIRLRCISTWLRCWCLEGGGRREGKLTLRERRKDHLCDDARDAAFWLPYHASHPLTITRLARVRGGAAERARTTTSTDVLLGSFPVFPYPTHIHTTVLFVAFRKPPRDLRTQRSAYRQTAEAPFNPSIR